MRLFTKLFWVGAVSLVFLNASSGDPACPCQSLPSNCPCQSQPANCPCQSQPALPPSNNCNDNCKNVQTVNYKLSQILEYSPLYQVIITVSQGDKPVDSTCFTYFQICEGYWLQFIVFNYADGTYAVEVVLVSDTKQAGKFRAEGKYLDVSGESSSVMNTFAFGMMNCTSQLIANYNCFQFLDCSMLGSYSDDIFVLSSEIDVSGTCLDQVEALFEGAGLRKGVLARPPHRLNRKCVTTFNGAPCLNADRVPAGDGIAYPPPQCNCAN